MLIMLVIGWKENEPVGVSPNSQSILIGFGFVS